MKMWATGERQVRELKAEVERLKAANADLARELDGELATIERLTAERNEAVEQAKRWEARLVLGDWVPPEKYEKVEATCAAMRAALENASDFIVMGRADLDEHVPVLHAIKAALATDVGCPLLERLERYERALTEILKLPATGSGIAAQMKARAALAEKEGA